MVIRRFWYALPLAGMRPVDCKIADLAVCIPAAAYSIYVFSSNSITKDLRSDRIVFNKNLYDGCSSKTTVREYVERISLKNKFFFIYNIFVLCITLCSSFELNITKWVLYWSCQNKAWIELELHSWYKQHWNWLYTFCIGP